jgi:hypothetical protein
MTRRDEDQDAGGPGGRAAERRRQFEQERGLSDRPRELHLDQEEAAKQDAGVPTPAEDDEPPTVEND